MTIYLLSYLFITLYLTEISSISHVPGRTLELSETFLNHRCCLSWNDLNEPTVYHWLRDLIQNRRLFKTKDVIHPAFLELELDYFFSNFRSHVKVMFLGVYNGFKMQSSEIEFTK